jgi:hypothetical protein
MSGELPEDEYDKGEACPPIYEKLGWDLPIEKDLKGGVFTRSA